MASRRPAGGAITGWSTPSIRNRTRNSPSYGSMWMSLAPRSMADARKSSTSRTTDEGFRGAGGVAATAGGASSAGAAGAGAPSMDGSG